MHGRHLRGLVKMGLNRLIAQFLEEIGFLVPLQAGRIKPVEQTLEYRKWHRTE
jgi:hypothetical protein